MREKLLAEGITVEKHLLWRNGEMIDTITADEVAQRYGFVYVEQLIHAVEAE